MSEIEKDFEETEDPTRNEADTGPDMIRRDFVKRFGAYAAGTCAGLYVLMSPRTSKVQAASDGGS